MLTVGSCFSGIGGFELGLEWTGGFETKWQIENDEYASSVLSRNWPNVKRYADIRDVSFPERVDVICGGFPCQDVSLAGARAGLEGKRSTLWGEMHRLICEVEPRWVLVENVPGLFSSDDGSFFGNILGDLASAGYDAEWGVLSAAGVGAPHLRRRVFIIANTKGDRNEGRLQPIHELVKKEIQSGINGEAKSLANAESAECQGLGTKPNQKQNRSSDGGSAMANAMRERRDAPRGVRSEEESGSGSLREPSRSDWWSVEPDVGRVANGIPSRVDRLRCLGNAVVPQVAQKVGQMILDYEKANP